MIVIALVLFVVYLFIDLSIGFNVNPFLYSYSIETI